MRPALLLSLAVTSAACGNVQSGSDPADATVDATPAVVDGQIDAIADAGLDAAWTHNAVWNAADGLPDGACAAWDAYDDASPELPVIVGDHLTLATDNNGEYLYYEQKGDALAFPDVFVMEARVRFVDGATATESRSGAGFGFSFGEKTNTLLLAKDQIFLLSAPSTKGPTYAMNTTDGFHDLRMEATLATGKIVVSVDGVPRFEGSTFVWAGVPDSIKFGDTSGVAHATSEWERVKHNAHVVGPCP